MERGLRFMEQGSGGAFSTVRDVRGLAEVIGEVAFVARSSVEVRTAVLHLVTPAGSFVFLEGAADPEDDQEVTAEFYVGKGPDINLAVEDLIDVIRANGTLISLSLNSPLSSEK